MKYTNQWQNGEENHQSQTWQETLNCSLHKRVKIQHYHKNKKKGVQSHDHQLKSMSVKELTIQILEKNPSPLSFSTHDKQNYI